MKWLKLGKIFDPTEHQLANNCYEFAQSPQTLVFNEFIRIYFSTREKDPQNGKYLSHIAFIDIKKDFKTIVAVSQKTVIPLGELGCFDEHGIFPMNILRYQDKILGYTCGWNRRISVSVDTAIGLALSNDDGLTFQKIGNGPILSASLYEPFLVGDPFVKFYNNQFHMWYIFGTNWKKFSDNSTAERIYKIGHALSPDGIHWTKEEGQQIISDSLNDDESQALPTIIKSRGQYHMIFCYRQSFDFRENKNRSYRLGYAYSTDLKTWVRDDPNVGIDTSKEGWDSDMLCYPHLFECDNKTYLLYNGNHFGKYGFGLAILS